VGTTHTKHAAAALKSEGFKATTGLRVRLGNDVRQLWLRDQTGKLSQLSAPQLRDHYVAESADSTKAEIDW